MMRLISRCGWIMLIGATLVAAGGASAQEPPAEPEPGPAPAVADTLIVPEPPSPRAAFLRSLVVPGWGQAWVGSPVRGGVYFAMEVGALWMTYKSRQKLREAREAERWMRETGQLEPAQPFGLTRAREDQVEDWMTLAIFFLFFNAADAWVSAHLADVGEHIDLSPGPGGGLRLQARVPVGGPR